MLDIEKAASPFRLWIVDILLVRGSGSYLTSITVVTGVVCQAMGVGISNLSFQSAVQVLLKNDLERIVALTAN